MVSVLSSYHGFSRYFCHFLTIYTRIYSLSQFQQKFEGKKWTKYKEDELSNLEYLQGNDILLNLDHNVFYLPCF